MSPSPGLGNSDRFRQYLENLGRDIEPGSGFFSPDTVFWRVSREPALLLAGMRTLLLQIAHPKIAQGVADHSRYREDPLGRGIRTFSAVYSLVFGRRDEAIEAAMRVRSVHDRVHGQVMGPTPAGMDSAYDANDPELLLWVAATLLDSSVMAYELFIEPLSAEEKEQFYQQAKRFGQLFGIPEKRYPDSWADFQNWWQEMLYSDTLTVTDTARDIYRSLLTGTWFTRLLAPFNYSMAALLLPERLVDSFGMRRNVLARMTFYIIVWITRGLVKLLPRHWRGVPAARRRE
ncbi:MAG: oxygenase MpaB family protein [Thiogranum sp.]